MACALRHGDHRGGTGRGIAVSHYRFFAFVLCLIVTLGQNYQAFTSGKIDWVGVAATYIGIPIFLAIWAGYRIVARPASCAMPR